jgi:hypothetical protein
LPEDPDDVPYGQPDPDPDHVPEGEPDPEPMAAGGVSGLPESRQRSEFLLSVISRTYRHFFVGLETMIDGKRSVKTSATLTAADILKFHTKWSDDANRRKLSLMVRPLSPVIGKKKKHMTAEEKATDDAAVYPRLIHLDDLKDWQVERVRPWAGDVFRTSPGNWQAIVFVTADYETFMALQRRMRIGLASGDDRPDRGANGSFRMPGSRNWKPGRDGCPVELDHVTFKDSWTPDQLERSGLLSPPPPVPEPRSPQPLPRVQRTHNGKWKFPDWQKCVDVAPRKKDGVTPDWSAADLAWCNICRDRGIPYDATYNELWRLRDAFDGKPTNHPDIGTRPGYVRRTVNKAYGIKN